MTEKHRPPLDTAGAAVYCGLPEGYMVKLRYRGTGPVFIKRNATVRYDPADLDDWLAAGKRRSTSDVREVA